MIPGEFRTQEEWIEINAGRVTEKLIVVNSGDRPIQIGSHFHFFEVNRALLFDRELAFGMRLNIPAGTAVRFEPGEEKPVELVALGGMKRSYGLSAITNGPAARGKMGIEVKARLQAWKGGSHAQDRP